MSKPEILKRIAFIGKSMLWSVCLYVLLMFAFNFDEIKNNMNGNHAAVVINTDQQSDAINKPGNVPASIAQHVSAFKGVIMIVKTICGIGAGMGK